MVAVSCIMSTIHGLGIFVVKGLMCVCQMCAELLLIFYFFLPSIGRWALHQVFSAHLPRSSGMPSLYTLFRQFCMDALNHLPYDPFALIRCHCLMVVVSPTQMSFPLV